MEEMLKLVEEKCCFYKYFRNCVFCREFLGICYTLTVHDRLLLIAVDVLPNDIRDQ